MSGPLEVRTSLPELIDIKKAPQNPIYLRTDVKEFKTANMADKELANDINALIQNAKGKIPNTEIERLILARLGQGKFRQAVLKRWENACAVTGIKTVESLRASHIKPWRESDNKEKLDPRNGLPLVATLDALFDRNLITFDKDGNMLVSPSLGESEKKLLGVLGLRKLRRRPKENEEPFLRYHREHCSWVE